MRSEQESPVLEMGTPGLRWRGLETDLMLADANVRRPSSEMDGTENRCLTEGAAPALDPTAAARAAEADRHVVADEPAATVDEDGWPARETRPVLLADAGGRAPHATSCSGRSCSGLRHCRCRRDSTAFVAISCTTRAGVGVVSEKSAVSAAVPSLRASGGHKPAFVGPPERGPAAKNEPGSTEERMQVPNWKSQTSGLRSHGSPLRGLHSIFAPLTSFVRVSLTTAPRTSLIC